jgi:hypothetical protein
LPQAVTHKEIAMMWPTFLNLWRTLSGKLPHKGSPRRPAYRRPCLEVLEDRAVPASLSYFSTSLNAIVYATAVDGAGDSYVTGQANSNLPTTPGAFETSGSGAFVAKLNPTGSLIYATYLGGGGDGGLGIAVDAAGDAYVIGNAGNVPTTANAIASSDGGDFVAELNATGSGLNYATYLPNTADGLSNTYSFAAAIALDGSGNIYVAGSAGPGLPVTASAFQAAPIGPNGGNSTPFFMKINPALSGAASIMYASYLGGSSGIDAATGIAVDSAGNAYLEGYTGSTNFPTTSGAFQTTKGTGFSAFVAKFDPVLSGAASLVYSTYLDGTTAEAYAGWNGSGFVPDLDGFGNAQLAGGIAVDSAGNAYVTSATTDTNFPTTAGAYQTTSNLHATSTYVPASDVFVTKLNATGSALVYSTYIGGGTIQGSGTCSGGDSIAVDAGGDAYVTGYTNSTSFPTKNPVQATNANAGAYDSVGDGMDAFVTELNPAGSGLLFSTYLGSSPNGDDYGNGIALDTAGNVYVGGEAAFEGIANNGNGFAAKINLAPSPSFAVTGFPSSTTAGVSHTFTVTALNADGSVNTNYTGTVHFTSSDPKAMLPADYTFTTGAGADNGVHTFTIMLKTAGSQSITATDTVTGVITGSESGIQVNPAAATHLVLSGPSTIGSGTAFSLTVTAVDAYGNTATGYRGTVHFSGSASSATLPGNYTFTAADNGVHTFSRVKLRTRGLDTITAIDTVFASISGSLTIDVT